MGSFQSEWAWQLLRCIPLPTRAMTIATHPTPLTLPAGTHALCTCGLSQSGAFCDGSHKGSGSVPYILKLEQEQTVSLCSCGASANKPFCDGSHLQLNASAGKP